MGGGGGGAQSDRRGHKRSRVADLRTTPCVPRRAAPVLIDAVMTEIDRR